MKTMYISVRNPKPVKPKTKLVCVNLSILTLSIFVQDLNTTKLNKNRSLLVELLLQVNSIQTRSKELDSN